MTRPTLALSIPMRRRAVRWLMTAAIAPFAILASPFARAQRQRLTPTPRDSEGPFYPRSFPADADADLTRVMGRAGVSQGTPLTLTGSVVATDGKPYAGATLELWQCDIHGTYHHVGASDKQDDDFQGYGRATTDANGRYAFRTIRPVPYGSRPPHLHFRISHTQARQLTTQLYLKGESSERGMGGFFARERDKLEIAPAPSQGGRDGAVLAATYTFVLESAST